ncbi:MAG: hypothetical protein KF866_04410 [Phycisphaeraceae bacterium]|nr:hypothetical protein [Phycisphaeraceae bacterium]MCW5753074.1 hypothetical protein [Phycisphaeraceae bacterium]
MSELRAGQYFGPYRLARPLVSHELAERWLALHVRQQSSHVVYRFAPFADRAESRRFLRAFEKLSEVKSEHLLPAEQVSFDSAFRGWLVTPYTGNQEGLLTLSRLLDLKGGQMGAFEAERAISQVLDAVGNAQSHGLFHGPVKADEILVDRHGALHIDLYGVRRAIRGQGEGVDLARDEIRGVAVLGYTLLTGLEPGPSLIAPSRVARRLDRAWDDWFEEALDPSGGFVTAAQAREALPTSRRTSERQSLPTTANPVRVVLNRFRSSANRR